MEMNLITYIEFYSRENVNPRIIDGALRAYIFACVILVIIL